MSRIQRIGMLCLALCLVLFCAACGTPQSQEEQPQPTAQLTEAPSASEEAPAESDEPAAGQTAQPTQKHSPEETENNGAKATQAQKTQPKATQPPQQSNKIKVTVKVDCATAAAKNEGVRKQYGSSGVIASKTVELEKGATVFDALKKVCPDAKAQGGYVYKIGSLSEMDMGKLSGWMYSVNGAYKQTGCKQKTLADGDVVRWRYTCDGGADIGGAV